MFNHQEFDNHERVAYVRDDKNNLKAIIALHTTALGPAFGGCRMWPYETEEQALNDVLRLSRGMTYKSAICGLPYGGGKAVIIGDSKTEKTPELLKAMGRAVESLGGKYIIADDVGTTLDDLVTMRSETKYTAAATEASQEPLAVTAYGVLMGILATVESLFHQKDFSGLKFAVQGLGNVGMPLCRMIKERGGDLVITDLDEGRVADAVKELGCIGVSPDEIYAQEVDIFVPCALGAIINDETIPLLNCKAICGGANNQLKEPRHGDVLQQHGITFVPDYLVNAGGVIDFYQENIDDSPSAIMKSVERIYDIAMKIFAASKKTGVSPLEVANKMVEDSIRVANDNR